MRKANTSIITVVKQGYQYACKSGDLQDGIGNTPDEALRDHIMSNRERYGIFRLKWSSDVLMYQERERKLAYLLRHMTRLDEPWHDTIRYVPFIGNMIIRVAGRKTRAVGREFSW